MKCVKTLGLLAVAATALMAFAATASATTLTDQTNAGAPYQGEIHGTTGKVTIKGTFELICHSGTEKGTVANPGGEGVTVGIEQTVRSISECTGGHVTVTKPGVTEIHTDKETNDGNGTVTWNAGAMNVQVTSVGISCEFTTEATDVGTLDGSRKTVNNKHPTAVITTRAVIPRTGGSFLCGSSAEWIADWTITTPDYLDVD